MAPPTASPILSETMLQRFRDRAPVYDRENRFFQEDFDELRRPGISRSPVPSELGGRGLTFAEVHARAAPAGLLRARHGAGHEHAPLLGRGGRRPLARGGPLPGVDAPGRRGRRGLRGRPCRTGQRHAAVPLHHEGRAGRRRLPVHRSQVLREPDPRLDLPGPACHGLQRSRGARRSSTPSCPGRREGYSIKETWDILGMRATASQDTVLQGAFVPDRYIGRVVPAGFAGADLFILAIFAWALTASPTSTTGWPVTPST